MNNEKKETYCEATMFCSKCDEKLNVRNILKKNETFNELELRTSKDISNLFTTHKCLPHISIRVGIPENCFRCGYKFKTFSRFFGKYSPEETRNLEKEFLDKVIFHKKEHMKSCLINHTQNRIVLFEKNVKRISKKKNS